MRIAGLGTVYNRFMTVNSENVRISGSRGCYHVYCGKVKKYFFGTWVVT